jgi:hypothetical protein
MAFLQRLNGILTKPLYSSWIYSFISGLNKAFEKRNQPLP